MKNLRSVLKVSLLSLLVIMVAAFQLHAFQVFKNMVNYRNISSISVPMMPIAVKGPSIRVALLLDTSNSMDGLIEQAKSRLWEILAQLGTAHKEEATPTLLISLYEYGNDRLSSRSQFVRQVLPFTTDMDLVSKKLFELTTNGGEEYCGAVIGQSLKELDWGREANDLRLIYIAGNEGFNQGPIPYQQSCANAAEKDVVINTIFCGPYETGIALLWKQGAQVGKGTYSSIDQNQATVYIETPYDDTILQLNKQLNKTYIPFGSQGTNYQQNQVAQDKNADTYGKGNTVNRALFKSSKNYSNVNWDLVDAYRKDKKVVTQMKEEELPENFRGKDQQTKVKLIETQAATRDSIQQEIALYKIQRSTYLKQHQSEDDQDNLGASILEPLRKKAAEKGFTMGDDKEQKNYQASLVDYQGFLGISQEIQEYREGRKINFKRFKKMSKEPGVIVLDTRSKEMYDQKHFKGAIHLNFSDFTEEKLAKVIPSKDTKILIYCNNNIANDPKFFAAKSLPLALNIPTFINLYGYGYKDIYELADLVPIEDADLEMEGTAVGN
ncbi:MAG: hypothetical protein DHS20C18_46370 [Saprospiraceae bacterium]|nr:MAG: hypothetical protein DHS20C18_46370 [Saprospiraceae bacterium]